jgi:hypothetical protein
VGWRQLSVCAALLFALPVWATTWDEPWQDEVVRKAETLVKVKVLANDGKSVNFKVVKTLAGAEVPAELTVEGFGLLRLTSTSTADDEAKFPFKKGESYYVLLTKRKDGKTWAVATPTTGYARIEDGNVYATFRHSYHQALVPEELYETTMTAIFLKTHDKKVDSDALRKTLSPILKKEPQGMPKDGKEKDQARLFFEQHAALETLAYFATADDLTLLEPFLKCDDYHVQISAVRALGGIDSREARERLFSFLESDGKGFAKVMAVWALKHQNARDYLPKLKELQRKAPEDRVGFGGNLMDPRVGTHFPGSVKLAINDLVAEWSKPETPAKPKPENPDHPSGK